MNGRCVSFMTSGSALRRIRMWSNARANWSRRRWVLRARFHPRIRLTLDSIRAPRRRRSRQLVAAALGFAGAVSPSDTIDFGLDTRAAAQALAQSGFSAPAPYAVLLHASSRPDKQWPEADWIALGRHLAQRGIALVLPWGNADEQAASGRIAAGIAAAGGAHTPPRLSLPAVVGLLNGA